MSPALHITDITGDDKSAFARLIQRLGKTYPGFSPDRTAEDTADDLCYFATLGRISGDTGTGRASHDADVKHYPTLPYKNTQDEPERRYRAIRLQTGTGAEEKLIGCVMITKERGDTRGVAEISYFLDPDYQGKGLGKEAVFRAVDKQYRQGWLQTVSAKVPPRNTASLNITKDFGMTIKGAKASPRFEGIVPKDLQVRLSMEAKPDSFRSHMEALAERYDAPPYPASSPTKQWER